MIRAMTRVRTQRPGLGAVDVGLALAVAGLELSDLLLFNASGNHDALAMVLSLASTLPLVLWRRQPFAVLQLTGWATVALAALGDAHLGLGPLVGTYAVAYWSGTVARRLAACLLAVAVWVVPLLTNDVANIPRNAALFAAAWILGALMRERAVTNSVLTHQAAELRREREENAMLAGQLERARIARELHDVLTHSVSVMVIQAQAAQSPGADSDRMLTALQRIEMLGKRSLIELRDLLRHVRPEDESPARAPQPSLAQLETLLAEVRATGLDVAFMQEGTACGVPLGIELSAYRIVQEALTNTIRHTTSPVAAVTVRYLPEELEVEVSDNGPATAHPGNGSGRGLPGMRERAALLGGSLTAESRPEGGFRVSARLPCR